MAKYLVLTGGSRGVGEKTIAHFVNQGWQAVNISRSNCPLAGVETINLDLSVATLMPSALERLQAIVKDGEQICLVHNAAVFNKDRIGSLSADDMRSVMNTNVISPVTLNNLLIPHMQPGSSIIYIGSTLSEQAVANRASYVVSKHAVIGLMRATCQDIGVSGIHTCCICPGFMNTKMITANADMTALMSFIESKVISRRLIEPEEIADYIYFCAMHPIVNGSVLHANLGQVTT